MRKNCLCRFLALMLALCCALPMLSAAAASYPMVGFTTDSLRLRKQPSENAAVLCTIPQGDAVLINGESGSYYVIVYEGNQGYGLKNAISANGAISNQAPAPVIPPVQNPVVTTAYTLLTNGDRGEEVTILQEALKELGFYSGKADGQFGVGTKNALIAFQKKNGLAQSGTADGATQQLIFEGKPKNSKGKAVTVKTASYLESEIIASGSIGSAVEKLQSRLKLLGYYNSSIDGECGNGTVKAIKAFQKKAGLSQTGKADANTKALLYSAAAPYANATASPKPTATPKPYATYAPSATEKAAYPYTSYTTSSVNLRKSASTTSARLMTIGKGEEIIVLSMDGDYLKVSCNGKTGYIVADYAYIPAQYLPGKDLATDSEAQANYPYLRSGSTGKNVTALQEALKELGFYTGAVNGNYDAATQSAVKAFQKKNGIKQDGVTTPEMQQLIFEEKPLNSRGKKTAVKTLPPIEGYPMQLNDKGQAVSELQQKLKILGYFKKEITGIYDSATQKAVRSFQSEHNLYVDGKAGKKTLTLLNALAVPAPTPDPFYPVIVPTNTPLTHENVIIMQNGTRGTAVERLQKRLMELGYYTCTVDGIYDSNDIAAVKEFQRKNGLKIDGIAGLDTQLRLYSASAVPATTVALPTAAPVPATPTPAPILETLRVGSSGEAVKALQQQLTTYGYFSGVIDGIFGTGTAAAVTRFQRANGLEADGVVGSGTRSKLNGTAGVVIMATKTPAATATPAPLESVRELEVGDKGAAVTAMQKRLVELGYLNAADGVYGPRTYNAVVAFQKKNGLTADGVAGKMTLTRLNSAAAIPAHNGIVITPSKPNTNTGSSTFTPPDAAEVRYANWFTEIRSRAKAMPDVVIYDPDSGLHFNLHMFSFGKHADSEPPTEADTEILYQINGKDNWDPKYVWVIFSDGRVYIASIHSNGHTVDHTNTNGMTGHICLHFPRIMSEAEATGPYAVRHQKEILYGWELTQAMAR